MSDTKTPRYLMEEDGDDISIFDNLENKFIYEGEAMKRLNRAIAELAAANERAEAYRKVAEELVEAMPIIPSPAHPADENYTKWRSAKAKLEALNHGK